MLSIAQPLRTQGCLEGKTSAPWWFQGSQGGRECLHCTDQEGIREGFPEWGPLVQMQQEEERECPRSLL